MARKWGVPVVVAVFVAVMGLAVVHAGPPSGAIFTTVWDGREVNYNIYHSKLDVYLDGGPGPGAPIGAAGLDEGDYVFQVTDPSGKVLLSTDLARCRQFHVNADGVIDEFTGGPDSACDDPVPLRSEGNHKTGVDNDHNAVTVQLMPFLDTPNPGGEYKVWVTSYDDYLLGCQALNYPGTTGLDVPGCDGKVKGNAHGFIPRHSKTDNFKVRGTPLEIDTRFHKNGHYIDGLGITWKDTLGASNRKYSYENIDLDIHHEAHVEAVEYGTHYITIENQLGCEVGGIYLAGSLLRKQGPQTVAVTVRPNVHYEWNTIWVDVMCK